jgi:O-antigen ligase
MFPENVIRSSDKVGAFWRTLGWIVAIACMAYLAFALAPASLWSQGAIPIVVVASLFVLLLIFVLASTVMQELGARTMLQRLALSTWWFLLVCEAVFDRQGETYLAYEGSFSVQAYGEGIMWVLAFLVLVITTLRQPSYLRGLFSGSYKWVVFFSLVCLLSVSYGPGKLYAGAWAFKLIVVVFLLHVIAGLTRNLDDIVTFLKVTLWAFFVLTVVPVLMAFSDPSSVFDGAGGRLNAGQGPDALTLTAASLMLLAMILYSIESRKHMIGIALLGIIVMFLALGKTGNLVGIFSALLFFLLQKKVLRSIGLLLGVSGLGLMILMTTPLVAHLRSYKGAATLTGRTAIWTSSLVAIDKSLILGHGYLATYFAWSRNSGLMHGIEHLHNGFLEVAYNNGIAGLGLMVLLHLLILRNIFKSIGAVATLRGRMPANRSVTTAHLLTVGSLAIYVNLFMNGMFAATFGGRAMSPFVLFLGLFVVVEALRKHTMDLLKDTAADSTETHRGWLPLSDQRQPGTTAAVAESLPW